MFVFFAMFQHKLEMLLAFICLYASIELRAPVGKMILATTAMCTNVIFLSTIY